MCVCLCVYYTYVYVSVSASVCNRCDERFVQKLDDFVTQRIVGHLKCPNQDVLLASLSLFNSPEHFFTVGQKRQFHVQHHHLACITSQSNHRIDRGLTYSFLLIVTVIQSAFIDCNTSNASPLSYPLNLIKSNDLKSITTARSMRENNPLNRGRPATSQLNDPSWIWTGEYSHQKPLSNSSSLHLSHSILLSLFLSVFPSLWSVAVWNRSWIQTHPHVIIMIVIML